MCSGRTGRSILASKGKRFSFSFFSSLYFLPSSLISSSSSRHSLLFRESLTWTFVEQRTHKCWLCVYIALGTLCVYTRTWCCTFPSTIQVQLIVVTFIFFFFCKFIKSSTFEFSHEYEFVILFVKLK